LDAVKYIVKIPHGARTSAAPLQHKAQGALRVGWLLVRAVVALLVAGVVALWATPPGWLAGFAGMIAAWARRHVLTAAGAGVLIGIAGVVAPLLLAWWQRGWSRRDAAASDQRRQARDRELMRKRVRNRWVKGVLEQSLADEARIRLGLTRRLDAIGQPDLTIRRPGRQPEPLPPGTTINTVFAKAGGVLLILGAPGSGKTTALLELARDLLDQADADSTRPMPVVFNLSSWAAQRAPLAEWLIDELHNRYDVPRSIATRWVDSEEILPLLDGLDEVTEPHRAGCVEAINAFRSEHGLVPFAVCSRTQEYTVLDTRLRVEDAIELQPPTRGQIYDYLEATGASLVDMRAALEADPTLWELLESPLVLSIVALTYGGRAADALRAPGTPAHRLTLLFKAYTERMLAHRPGPFTSAQTRSWLGWLARSMRDRNQSEFHLDRLQPDWLPTTTQQRLAALSPAITAGLIIGLIGGLADGLLFGLVHGVVVGLEIGLFFGLFFGLRKTEGVRWSWSRISTGLIGGLVTGLVTALIDGFIFDLRRGLSNGLAFTLIFALIFVLFAGLRKTEPVEEVGWSWLRVPSGLFAGLVVGLGGGLVYGLAHVLVYGAVYALTVGLLFALLIGLVGVLIYGLVPGLVDERSTPNEGIRRSARHALAIGLIFALAVGLISGLVFELIVDLANGLGEGLRAGLVVGLVVGLLFGGLACLQHFSLRGLLTSHGFAPLRYVRFLDDATQRLFLRRTGSGYIFIHRLLLEYFADLQTASPRASAEPPVNTPPGVRA
jgi:hypothetical protein